ncbi:hypothetical protein GCM10009609_17110 [Pseudonocardia aurantiaca]|uniref:histidine kinase n=1 Tax=Pseudonocardia aurantiaca TaxID=75290 RepID=A0ABW4FKM5_9PSEU
MADVRIRPSLLRWLSCLLVSVALVAAVSAALVLLEPYVPVLSLLVLYLLAVLPVAFVWGVSPAAAVSVASVAVFAVMFLPSPAGAVDPRDVFALGVFLITAVVVGELAARSRRQAREAARLVEEQAALRRVATLVAQGTPRSEVFEAVLREVALLCGADLARLERYEADGTVLGVAGWSRVPVRLAVGTRFTLDGLSVAAQVRRTGGAVRVNSFARAGGEIAREARELGIRASVGCPIMLTGRLWGVIAASSSVGPFPDDTESQIADFTDLLATAIANAESRGELNRLAEEQAALRRVATQVALGASQAEVFTTVTDEVARLLHFDLAVLQRFEPDGTATHLAGGGWNAEALRMGQVVEVDPCGSIAAVMRTGRSAQTHDFSRAGADLADVVRREAILASAASPITVEGKLWGVLAVASRTAALLSDVEQRLSDFTELVATAVANTQSRAEITTLVQDLATRGRVATLVACGTPADQVFAAVVDNVGRALRADATIIVRYDDQDGLATVVARIGGNPLDVSVGSRVELEPSAVLAKVRLTGRSCRDDGREDHDNPASGEFVDLVHGVAVESVATPIVLGGRTWGALGVGTRDERFPGGAEQRMAGFAELVAIAAGNAESQAELAASRARVVVAADEARRRIERDLHDGVQQRLVSLGLEMRLAESAVPPELGEVRSGIGRMAEEVTAVLDELREMSRGIHPAILSEGGLGPALRTLARRSVIPVEVDVRTDTRFPEAVEVAAYYVACEALANTAKHARASHATVAVRDQDGAVHLAVHDDGVGGARPVRGSGLIGLRDRVEALGGLLVVRSAPGDGTLVMATLPPQPS